MFTFRQIGSLLAPLIPSRSLLLPRPSSATFKAFLMDSTTNSVHGRFTIKALPHAQAPGSLTEFSTVVNSSQPNQTAPAIIRIPPGTSNSLPTGDDTAVVSVHGSYTFASDGTIIIDTFPNGVEVITNPDPQSPECVQVFNTMGTLSKVNYKSLDACMVEIKVNPAGKKVSMYVAFYIPLSALINFDITGCMYLPVTTRSTSNMLRRAQLLR